MLAPNVFPRTFINNSVILFRYRKIYDKLGNSGGIIHSYKDIMIRGTKDGEVRGRQHIFFTLTVASAT